MTNFRYSVRQSISLFITIIAATAVSGCSKESTQTRKSNPLAKEVSSRIEAKDLGGAQKLVDEALKSDAKNSNALYLSSLIAVKQRNYDKALDNLNQSLEIEPGNAAAYSERALVETRTGKIDSALDDANHAIELDDTDAIAFHRRALINIRQKNFKQALEDLDTSAKIDPESSPYYICTNRGDAFLGLKQYDQAKEQYAKAVTLAPKGNFEALLGRALCEAKVHDYQSCEKDVQQIIAADPHNGLALSLAAVVSSIAGKHQQATKLFRDALPYCPNETIASATDVDQSALVDLASACLNSGDPTRTISIIEKVQDDRPLEVSEQLVLARAYFAKKQTEKAIHLLTTALSTEPSRTDVRVQLIRIYATQGLVAKAKEVQRDGIALAKNDQERALLRSSI